MEGEETAKGRKFAYEKIGVTRAVKNVGG